MPDQPSIDELELSTTDGVTLQGEVCSGATPIATAVLCHPHPLYGGDMYNNVVTTLFHHLGALHVDCVRFNFRGVGRSNGTHGKGVGERADIEAAVAEMASRHPDLPLIVGGYSFGADVSLTVDDDRIAGWLCVAPPLGVVDIGAMTAGADVRPKAIVTGSNDNFRPPDQLETATAGWQSCELSVAEGADHFFMTGLDTVRDTASGLVGRLTGS